MSTQTQEPEPPTTEEPEDLLQVAESEDQFMVQEDAAEVISLSSQGSQNTTTQDLLDVHIETDDLLTSVETLQTILKLTKRNLESLSNLEDDLNQDAAQQLLTICVNLDHNVDELWQVIKPNAKTGDEHSGDGVPLAAMKAMVYKWATDCVIALLGLQADTDRAVEQYRTAEMAEVYSDTASWADTLVSEGNEEAVEEIILLHSHLGNMQQLDQRLNEFLPILKADLDEYKMANLQFPSQDIQPSGSYTVFERERGSSQFLKDDNAHLRRFLYSIKDQLRSCLQTLQESVETCQPLPIVQPLLHQIRVSSNALANALTEMLSNNGSEWIESELSGRMTWGEFCVLLDSKENGSSSWTKIAQNLRDLRDALQLEGARVRAGFPYVEQRSDNEAVAYLAIVPEDLQPVLTNLVELEKILKPRGYWRTSEDS